MDWNTIISGAALIAVAIIEAIAAGNRRRDKEDKERTRQNEERRAKESRLCMQFMDASLDLGLATALAVENRTVNGEMKAARAKAKRAQAEYDKFIQETASREIAKV